MVNHTEQPLIRPGDSRHVRQMTAGRRVRPERALDAHGRQRARVVMSLLYVPERRHGAEAGE
jgi:hypothetical protein